jgi:SAM-dependent methyltransferase
MPLLPHAAQSESGAGSAHGKLAALRAWLSSCALPLMDTNEYLKLAEVEDRMWYFRSLHRHVHTWLAAGLRNRKDAEVLDAGCGTGGLILRLQQREPDWRFTGLDFSALACELGAKRCPRAKIHEGSITALPFADASFDALVSADVICQVDNPATALSEFFRCLRPGGTVVINVPAYMWMWSYHDDSCQTKHRYLRRELVGMLGAAGFAPTFSTHWNTLPFPLLVMKRKLFRSRSDTSDVRLYPRPLEATFNAMMQLEHAWLHSVGRLPYGSSVFVVANKAT